MKIGICFGGYCPMHQGHLDLIMQAKKENDCCYVVVCGYDDDPKVQALGISLPQRTRLVEQLFAEDEQVRVLMVDDTLLGIDESMLPSNWQIWTSEIARQMAHDLEDRDISIHDVNQFCWYVGEKKYQEDLTALSCQDNAPVIAQSGKMQVLLLAKVNPVSGTLIREQPAKYWQKIAWTFRPYLSTNILISGTASEGKSTLTRDIATYFGLQYSEEYARTYMSENNKPDEALTAEDFKIFLTQQVQEVQNNIYSRANTGIVLSDTDNMVTLMYAKSYAEDDSIQISEEDYNTLFQLAQTLRNKIIWDKIFVLVPKNTYVDDGLRYMKHSEMESRKHCYDMLLEILTQFGFADRVELLSGSYLDNFNRVKEYIESKLK